MDWKNARSVEAKISRLTREIAKIDAFFYHTNKADDRALYAAMLERKRDDMVRSAVLQLHTAIEDILNSWIICPLAYVPKSAAGEQEASQPARCVNLFLALGALDLT